MPSPVSSSRPIRIVHARDIGDDVARFYAEFATEPVIVRGAYADEPALAELTPDSVRALFAGRTLEAYERGTQAWARVAAEEIFAGFRTPTARYNVVDHPVGDSPFAGRLQPPPFLRHNWFAHGGAATAHHELSLICSAAGSFTPIHADGYGVQGWMWLAYGEKHWEIYRPECTPLIFDHVFKEFYHSRKDAPDRFPYLAHAEKFTGVAAAGDLLFFPAAWPHEVSTTAECFGIGGCLINDAQIEASMRCWLWERAQAFAGELDFKAFVADVSPGRCLDPAGAARTARALALCAEWETKNTTPS